MAKLFQLAVRGYVLPKIGEQQDRMRDVNVSRVALKDIGYTLTTQGVYSSDLTHKLTAEELTAAVTKINPDRFIELLKEAVDEAIEATKKKVVKANSVNHEKFKIIRELRKYRTSVEVGPYHFNGHTVFYEENGTRPVLLDRIPYSGLVDALKKVKAQQDTDRPVRVDEIVEL